MRLFLAEIKKLWSKKEVLLYFAVLISINIFLLWIDTSSVKNNIPHSAYRKMTTVLSDMSMEEKEQYVSAQYDMICSIVKIDNVMRYSHYDKAEAKKQMATTYKEDFEKYGSIYQKKAYLYFTDSLYSEYRFLDQINTEIEQAAGYSQFLEDIQRKADMLSQISIFNKEGSYDSLNIKATAKAYKDIENIKTDYYPQTGFVKAVSFRYSDLVLLFAMILLASYIVRQEKDSDMLTLIRTMPNGKRNTAIAKLLTMSASLLVVVTMTYVVNLLFCNAVYGIGDLGRSIQSVPYLMRSTLRVNLFEYIILFIFTKWIAAVICGVWVLYAMLISKTVFGGYILSLSMPLINLLIRNSIHATSNKNVIKYSNLASFLTTNEILGGYRNLHWFGTPVTLFRVEITAAIIYFVLFTVIFIGTFEYAKLGKAKQRKHLLNLFNTKKATTVEKQEWYKTLIMNGAAVVLALFTAYMGYTAYTRENYITADEMFYAYYMKAVTGPYDRDAYDFMLESREKFKPIYEAEQLLKNKRISYEEYQNIMGANYSLNLEYQAYQRVRSNISMLKYYPDSQLLYETGYDIFFDFNDNLDLKDYMICVLVVVLCTCGRFTIEKTSGMNRILAVTPKGREYTIYAKKHVSDIIAVITSVLLILPRIYRIAKGYGFKGLFVTANSMTYFRQMNRYILVIEFIALMLAARILVALAVAKISLYISSKSDSYISSAMFSLLLLEFPALLAYLNISWAKYMTLYPLFHVIPNLTVGWKTLTAVVYLGGISMFSSSSSVRSGYK